MVVLLAPSVVFTLLLQMHCNVKQAWDRATCGTPLGMIQHTKYQEKTYIYEIKEKPTKFLRCKIK